MRNSPKEIENYPKKFIEILPKSNIISSYHQYIEIERKIRTIAIAKSISILLLCSSWSNLSSTCVYTLMLDIYLPDFLFIISQHRKFQDIRQFYIIAVGVIFATAMAMQIPYLNVPSNLKIIIFVGWALFGILPTTHWAIKMGGLHNKMVSVGCCLRNDISIN